jgi:hypothetical protein
VWLASLQTNSTRGNWSNMNKMAARLHISLHLHNLFSFSGCEPDLPGALTPPQALDIPFSLLAARAGRLQGLPLAQAAFTTAPAWKSKSHASARALMSELGGG